MTNQNDSFIDEVTEDLRRDRLFAAFRRYGWIGGLVILSIVGGAAFTEWQKAQREATAQAYGDALVAALAAPDPATALAGVDAAGSADRAALTGLLQAGAEPDPARAAEILAGVGAASQSQVMRDLARLKEVTLNGAAMEPAARDALLTELSKPGAPFELLALEQKAVALVQAGRTEDAVTLIHQIQQQDGLTEGLSRRLSEMLITLGGEPSARPSPPGAEAPAAEAPVAGTPEVTPETTPAVTPDAAPASETYAPAPAGN